jgi:hypothetical protein
MKKIIILLNLIVIIMLVAASPAFPQANIFSVAPGAEGQLSALLNKPALVRPAAATSLGRNWFRLETDAHVITDQVSVRQVVAVLLDIENQARYFDGRRSKITTSVVSRSSSETIVDYVTIAIVPVVNIQLRTPYRASVRTVTNTDTSFALDIRQLAQDSETNTKMKNLYAPRYVQEVTINGRNYTYIRIYSIVDIDMSILALGAKNTLENNAGPTNEEALQMIITAARSK